MTISDILKENEKRNEIPEYDPYTGVGAPLERKWLKISDFYIPEQYVPVGMFENPIIDGLNKIGSIEQYILALGEEYNAENREIMVNSIIKIRIRYDFFYWAASFVKIKNKEGGKNIPFILNRPQRRLVSKYEEMRLAGKPIRLILLKARQWGGSTATQIYMAWIQLVHKEGWYSAIIAQDNSSSQRIKAMYSKLLDNYPPELLSLEGDKKLEFGSYGGSKNDSIIKQNGEVVRDTVVSIGSVKSPNSVRSGDISMAHFSEIGVWNETAEWNASSIIRSVSGSILNRPLTMIVYESTANGTGNFFYDEWQRAKEPEGSSTKSNMFPLFVPWFEIELYREPFKTEEEKEKFAGWLLSNKDDDTPNETSEPGKYYWWLWEIGASLENIHWYINQRKEFSSHADMAAEFPSDDIEAFKHSGHRVFDIYKLEELRKNCIPPIFTGEIAANGLTGEEALENVHFVESEKGNLFIWEFPDEENDVRDRYIVVVDPQKGISESADFSDILVLDRYWKTYGGKEAVVAEWHGHIDKDLLAWKSAQIAQIYDNALLVIERNTFDNEKGKSMDESEFIIDVIAGYYRNMYIYVPKGKVIEKESPTYGFITNRGTKPAIINNMIAVIRENGYIERSADAIKEMNVYEEKENGNWGAMEKYNDDRVMTRAIGLWISGQMDLPSKKKRISVINKTIKQQTYKPL